MALHLVSLVLALALLAPPTTAQVPPQPTPFPATCDAGYTPQTITSIRTLGYNFSAALPYVSNFFDVSGRSLDSSQGTFGPVASTGSATSPGATRSYSWSFGSPPLNTTVQVTDTLLYYSLPTLVPSGQTQQAFQEVHRSAPLLLDGRSTYALAAFDNKDSTAIYFPYISTTAASVCGGLATRFNFTSVFCTNNTANSAAIVEAFVNSAVNAAVTGLRNGGEVAFFYSCAVLVGMYDDEAACVANPYDGLTGAVLIGGYNPATTDFSMMVGNASAGAGGSGLGSNSTSGAGGQGYNATGTATRTSTPTRTGTPALFTGAASSSDLVFDWPSMTLLLAGWLLA